MQMPTLERRDSWTGYVATGVLSMLMSQSFRVMKSRLSMYRPSWLNLTSEMLEMISEKKLRAACTQSLTINAAAGLSAGCSMCPIKASDMMSVSKFKEL